MQDLSDAQRTRFWTKVDRAGLDDCWRWEGAVNPRGYGTWSVSLAGRCTSVRPHRVAWFLTHGVLDEGVVIDHKCGTRTCVNPQHLDAVEHLENIARISPTGWAVVPIGHLVSSLLTTHSDSGFARWWRTWLGASEYDRRQMEREAVNSAGILPIA
ncbi:HNH endonuclease [Gordonia polyisoprenivorans]|uniref:HNH endonuclease signature motif containing protein n=1 Tax=Gordonia polyisoprenivorans TaxID=84595 RepID=UPI002B2DBC1C|nr:HNH endonuclease [Gordonia polyisoprenivorans]